MGKNINEYGILRLDDTPYRTRLSRKFLERKPYIPIHPGWITSFIPGTITDVAVKEGQDISEGEVVVILDAMKMQNRLKSHISGRVKKVHVKKGDRVAKGAVLIEIEEVK